MTDQNIDNQSSAPIVSEQVSNAQAGSLGESIAGTTGSLGEATNVSGPTSFTESLSDEYRAEASLKNFKDVNDLAKSYIHAQKELGARIRIPGPDANDEMKSEFDKRMEQSGYVRMPDRANPDSVNNFMSKVGAGRPEAPDKYVLNAPEGIQLDDDQVGVYKQVAHNLGLNQDQAHKLFQFELQRSAKTFEAGKEHAANALKEAWGNEFNNKIDLAKDVLRHYEGTQPQAVADIRNNMTGNNPLVLMMAAELGRMYKESGVINGSRNTRYGLTPEEARSRIQEVQGNSAHAYYNDSHPDHRTAVQEVERLYNAAYPTQNRE